ncbi:MAG: NapC/NirT family cytochrome c [Gammaproteobacteria bacterium]
MFFKKLTILMQQPKFRHALLWVLLGLGSGVLLWNGFTMTLDATSSTEFCVSCHSMQAYVYEGYKQSLHYRNPKGITADCADCHVPKPLGAKLLRKTIALNDLYHTLLGSIDTPEKFAVKKPYLAERVWKSMRANDSRECRSCHRLENMDFEQQSSVASKQHQQAKQLQKTCIDCHKGVGHKPVNAEQGFSLE